MPEEKLTQFKTTDWKTSSVEYLTEEAQQPAYVRRLAKSAREASRAAIRRLQAAGIPAYYAKGRDLVRLLPDGREEIVIKDLLK